MINDSDIDLLCDPMVMLEVERRLGDDPARIALDARLPHARLIATQVKYLQRARVKIPSYYGARCIMPGLAFEQSSSEDAMAVKQWDGECCLDLTCGLGVDAYGLSKRFNRVVTLERDPALARIARINFSRLGAANVEVINNSAENFLAGASLPHADMVYADPDRRGDGNRKLVLLEDCSPDVVSLMPRLKEMAGRVVVKCSPMFDVAEAFHKFGERSCATVLSVKGECKEVLIETGDSVGRCGIVAAAVGIGEEYFGRRDGDTIAAAIPPAELRYVVLPDVALRKGRVAAGYFARRGIYCEGTDPVGFHASDPGPVMGRVLRVKSVSDYNPRALKTMLKHDGCRRLGIIARNFPLSAPAIAKALGVGDGGGREMLFTKISGQLSVVETVSEP